MISVYEPKSVRGAELEPSPRAMIRQKREAERQKQNRRRMAFRR